MRRAATVLAALACSALIATSGAAVATSGSAVSTRTVTWHPGAEPTGAYAAGWWSSTCDNTAASTNPHTSVNDDTAGVRRSITPVSKILGSVSWSFTPASAVRFGPAVRIPDPSGLTGLGVTVREPEGNPIYGRALAYYADPNPAGGGQYWIGESTIEDGVQSGSTMQWHELKMGGAPFTWRRYDSAGNPAPSVDTTTIAGFVQSHLSAEHQPGPLVAGFELGCRTTATGVLSTTSPIAFDDIVVTTHGTASTTTYDVEGPAARITMRRTSAGTLSVGGRAALTGTLLSRLTGKPMGGRGTLQAKAYGSRLWRSLTSRTGSVWRASSIPSRRTSYRWRYSSNGVTALSSTTTVNVRARVFAHVSKTKLLVHKSLRITGSTKPAKRVKVHLQRRVGNHWKTLKSTRTARSGKFSFSLKPGSTGTWTLRVTVSAASGNLGASSPSRAVTIKTKPKKNKPKKHHGGGSTGGSTGGTTGGGSTGGGGTDPCASDPNCIG